MIQRRDARAYVDGRFGAPSGGRIRNASGPWTHGKYVHVIEGLASSSGITVSAPRTTFAHVCPSPSLLILHETSSHGRPKRSREITSLLILSQRESLSVHSYNLDLQRGVKLLYFRIVIALLLFCAIHPRNSYITAVSVRRNGSAPTASSVPPLLPPQGYFPLISRSL